MELTKSLSAMHPVEFLSFMKEEFKGVHFTSAVVLLKTLLKNGDLFYNQQLLTIEYVGKHTVFDIATSVLPHEAEQLINRLNVLFLVFA